MKSSYRSLVLAGLFASLLSAAASVNAQAQQPQQPQLTVTAQNPANFPIPNPPYGLQFDQDMWNAPTSNIYSSNAVIAWNALITARMYKPFAVQNAHQLAELTSAVHDALNTINLRYQFFLGPAVLNLPNERIANAHAEGAIAGVYTYLMPILYQDLQFYATPIPTYVYDPVNDLPGWDAEIQNFWQYRNQTLLQPTAQPKWNPPAATNNKNSANQLANYLNQYNTQLTNNLKSLNQQIAVGFAIGQACAAAIHAARADDGHNRYQYYNPQPPSTTNAYYLGQWRTTGVPQSYAQYADVKPFAIDAIPTYAAPAPPALYNQTYIDDLYEVMYKGTTGTGNYPITPTATQDEINLAYWVSGIGADVISNIYLQALIIRDYKPVFNDVWATARLFALVQVATLDANIVNQYNKRKFNFWRPHDALVSLIPVLGVCTPDTVNIGQLDCDPGLSAFAPGTQVDPNSGQLICGNTLNQGCWVPFINDAPSVDTVQGRDPTQEPNSNVNPVPYTGTDPNTSEWPAGLPTQISAAAEVIGLGLMQYPWTKDGMKTKFQGGPLTIQYNSQITGVTFDSLDTLKQLAVNGTIFAGQHARTSGVVGLHQGQYVAREVYANAFAKPGYGRVKRFFDIFFTAFTW